MISSSSSFQQGRGRQGLLPDFKLELPTPEGDHEIKLEELKVIGAVDSWYPRSGFSARRTRVVERRSRRLAGSTGDLRSPCYTSWSGGATAEAA